MSIDSKLWSSSYTLGFIPEYNCPRCHKGTLAPMKPVEHIEPKHSEREHGHPEHDVDWVELRLSFALQCSSPSCGEIVSLFATGYVYRDYDEYHEMEYVKYYSTKMLYPSPWLFEVHPNTPDNVKDQIVTAFNSYWVDYRLCANALRTSLELLLDSLDIPRKKSMDLARRIDVLEQQNPENAKSFTALRLIGNLGSHGADVTQDAIFDAFSVYEYFLLKLFDEREAEFVEIRDKLIETKGKY